MKRFPQVLLVIALLAIGAAWYFGSAARPVGPGAGPVVPALNPEVAARVARDLPLAVAHLENQQPEKAIVLLTELEKDLPTEKCVLQNLAVAKFLLTMSPKPGTSGDQLKQDALTQLNKLITARPDDWHSYALLGMYLEQVEDYAAAFSQFDIIAPIETTTNAGAQRPADRVGDQSMLYAMARTGLKLPDGPERADAKRALVTAVERQSEDLWLLLALIDEQVTHKDPDVQKTLEKFLAVAPLVAEPIKRAQRFDILESIRAMQTAVAASDWKLASRSWSPVRNLVTPADASQTDRKKIQRHPLDFVVDRIAVGDSDNPHAPATGPSSPAIDLAFAAWELPEPLRAPGRVLDARWADLTFDRQPELCVLEPNRLSVWAMSETREWRHLSECPVEGANAMRVADLDDDAREVPLALTPGVVGEPIKRADLDFVVTGDAGLQIIKNDLVEGIPKLSLLPKENVAAFGAKISCVEAADFDGDGDLDLLVASELGLQLGFNTGAPKFEVRSDTPASVPQDGRVTRIEVCDVDRDHDVDAFVVSNGRVYFLDNMRHGTLRWSDVPMLKSVEGVSDVAILDSDGNASWDLLLSGSTGQRLCLSRTIEEGAWRIVREVQVGAQLTPASTMADLDNDGFEDLIGLGRDLSLRRGALAAFETAPANWKLPAGLADVLHSQAIDADADGDLDLCLTTKSGLALWENQGGNQNSWLSVEVVAAQVKDSPPVPSGRVNHYGICSLLEAKTKTGYQARVIQSGPAHFGLGPAGQAEIVRMVWQNGSPVNVIAPTSNQTLWEIQTLTGSCPYLYLWDGEKYVFATDLLWSAPLGMPSPAGGDTPSREWEYLKLAGSLLKERDGAYSLQLTEELYEAAYFDKVQLIAVDHPSDVAVYSNEKVGPPSIAEKKLHAVRQPRTPLSAKDQLGRDLLPALSQLDEIYTQHWDHKVKQGWTEKTTLELDLGAVPEKSLVTLFMTGWVYPTDPAISVSIQQDPARAGYGIQPPSLEVPDGNGGWKTASPYIGFPGGKTKTIAIDLTGQLVPNDGRVRIVTSMELCWDQVFFTVDEAPAEVRETPLELLSADLHFRGCSARVIHPQYGPERYDYSRVDPAIYSLMGGKFTRYGDVRELLTSQDDRMVVLGCGDECTLRFSVPPAPPAGWTRDFLIHNVGWDKDCNAQNTYSKTVEPLPFAAMHSYPPANAFPDDELHRDYLKTYQTREQTDVHFRRFLLLTEGQSAGP